MDEVRGGSEGYREEMGREGGREGEGLKYRRYTWKNILYKRMSKIRWEMEMK